MVTAKFALKLLQGDVTTASPYVFQLSEDERKLLVGIIAQACRDALAREKSQRAAWGDAVIGAFVAGKVEQQAGWWVMRDDRVIAVGLFKPWARVPPVAPE